MNARIKRRVRASLVASALASGIIILTAFGMMTALRGGTRTTATPSEATTGAAITEVSLSGDITKLNDDSFELKDADSKVQTVTVDDDTIYTLDGSEALFSSLEVGHTVSVQLKPDSDKTVAKSVDATSRVDD